MMFFIFILTPIIVNLSHVTRADDPSDFFNKSCALTSDCHDDNGADSNDCSKNRSCGFSLVCLNKRCDCDPAMSIFEFSKTFHNSNDPKMKIGGHCVGKVGSPCVHKTFCTTRATCSTNSTCECQPGSMATVSGECKTAYSGHCTSANDCAYGLVCKDQKCACQYSDQIYDHETGLGCLSKAGEPCSPPFLNCVKNARCESISQKGGPGHCVCAEGYADTREGDCKAIFGEKCNLTSDCHDVSSLVCLNNECQCSFFAKFDFLEGRCIGLVGSKCILGSPQDDIVCTAHASCQKSHPKLLGGHCTCDAGFVENDEYICVPSKQNDDEEEEDYHV